MKLKIRKEKGTEIGSERRRRVTERERERGGGDRV